MDLGLEAMVLFYWVYVYKSYTVWYYLDFILRSSGLSFLNAGMTGVDSYALICVTF